MNVKKVLLDTNALMYIGSSKFDIKKYVLGKLGTKYKLYVPSSVIDELKKISTRSLKERIACNVALEWIKNNCEIVPTSGRADKVLLELSKDYYVLTFDRRLKRKIKNKGGKII